MRASPVLPSLLLAALAFAGCSSDTDGLGDGGTLPCTTADDCPGEQLCEAQVCVDPPAPECTDDDGCAPGFSCEEGACVPTPCEQDDDCGDGICGEDGVCAEPECSDEAPCDEGFVCDDGRCVEDGPTTCESDDDCDDDTICVFGTCQAPTFCEDSAECPGDLVCIDEVCREPCTQDSDCGSALMYNCIEATGECQLRCLNDGMCPAGQFCRANLCEPAECEQDADCAVPDEICEGEEDGRGRCVEVTPCGPNGECPTGFACDDATGLCEALPGCRTDRDCDGDEYCEDGYCQPSFACTAMSCPGGFECVGDVCVPQICRADGDCPSGEVCVGGACQAPPGTDFVTSVRIISPPGYVRPGTAYRFVALAQDQAGRVVPGVRFSWSSTSTTVAAIDADGLATGGADAGVTQIRARVTSQIGPVVSAPVSLTNLGPAPAAGVRVTVVAQTSGLPVANATVEVVAGGQPATGTTDASGVVSLPNVGAGPYEVTAVHADFDWVTVLGASTNDVRLELPPLSRPDRAAGARGNVDLSQVTTQGALSLSLSGASLGSPLLSSDPGAVFGGEIYNAQVPMLGNVPVPGGNTVRVEFMGFPITLKDTYYARAKPGLRALWSFGGKVDFGGSGLGLGDLQNLLAALLPFYQRFEHTVDPAVPILALPTVADTNDVDGDGDTQELVPDWSNLPNRALTPSQAQTLRYQLTVDNLPFVSGGNANTLVVMSGVVLPGVGFVPLGIDGQSDGMGNGIVPSFVTKMAPPHGGLEAGDYAVLVAAIRTDTSGLPGPGSVRLYTSDRLPTAVDLSDGWIDSPVDATVDLTNRQATLPALPRADMYHLAFANPEGTWHVYAAAGAGVTTITVPTRPDLTLPERVSGAQVTVDAVDLDPSASPATLFDASAGSAVDVDRVTRAFSRAVVE